MLPVLGALPDSLIILTSLSSASQAEAQEAVAVGIGETQDRGGWRGLRGRVLMMVMMVLMMGVRGFVLWWVHSCS